SEAAKLTREGTSFLHLALPQHENVVTHAPQRKLRLSIALNVSVELRHPERSVAAWCRCLRATQVAVPVTTVHEDSPASRAVGEIRRAWEVTILSRVSQAQCVACVSHCEFGLGTALAYASHPSRRACISRRRRTVQESLL